MDKDKIKVSFTLSKKVLKIIGLGALIFLVSMLPGGFLFVLTVVLVTLLVSHDKERSDSEN